LTASHEEKVCAAIACDVLGARWRRIEDSHDFDIVFPKGRIDYLEVSAFTHQAMPFRPPGHVTSPGGPIFEPFNELRSLLSRP
jgi:hypothetical protein